ncbi:PREDICTED: uncharacterized protein LOC108571029 [Habropoda laboriosa]|uniref:uncharacterized protein LOC108571029 n=1 Tax=Habropoda laboriosa TaxID=597456 RepID=UPI00083D708C|nr:PREDICTED: uncharacterized protein LOC108571029 [Habropoda laboriosa]
MEKRVLFLCNVYLVFVLVSAKPLPENYEDLAAKDTVRYPYAFWLGRPIYDRDDDGDNTYYNLQPQRRTSTISYASIGGGWGR